MESASERGCDLPLQQLDLPQSAYDLGPIIAAVGGVRRALAGQQRQLRQRYTDAALSGPDDHGPRCVEEVGPAGVLGTELQDPGHSLQRELGGEHASSREPVDACGADDSHLPPGAAIDRPEGDSVSPGRGDRDVFGEDREIPGAEAGASTQVVRHVASLRRDVDRRCQCLACSIDQDQGGDVFQLAKGDSEELGELCAAGLLEGQVAA
jgi:hypothetical protein